MLIKIAIAAIMLIIVASLASALVALMRGHDHRRRLVRSLTLRITLSIALIGLLVLAQMSGLIQPHGLLPPPPDSATPSAPTTNP